MLRAVRSLTILVGAGLLLSPSMAWSQPVVIQDNVTIQTTSSPTFTFHDLSGHTGHIYSYVGTASGLALAYGFVVQSGGGLGINSTNVGLGIGNNLTPAAYVHAQAPAISGAELVARFHEDDDSIGRIDFNNASSTDGVFIARVQGKSGTQFPGMYLDSLITSDTGVGPAIVYNATRGTAPIVTRPLIAYRNNNVAKMTIAANRAITATSFNPVSSRTLKSNIANLDSDKASAILGQLSPVEFIYKDDPTGEKRLGFIAEDVPELVADADRRSVPIMDVFAVVTRVVKDQQRTIDEQKSSLAEQDRLLKEQNASLKLLQEKIALQQIESDRQQERRIQRQKTVDQLMERISTLERMQNSD